MYSRIVVGTDGTDRSLIAVNHAAKLAAAFGADLHVVAVASPADANHEEAATMGDAIARLSDLSARTAARIARDVSRRHGVRVIEHPQVGEPASVLMAVAEQIDAELIVVGNTRMNGRPRRFAGSVPSRLARQSAFPLLIVHTG